MVAPRQRERAHLCAVGMHHRLLLIATLIAASTGNPLPHVPPVQVVAFAGEAVILPCSFSPTASDDFPTVEWSKEDLQPNVVFLYRDGCETYEMKNPLFQYRTSFIPKELKNRNVSLRLSNVQLTDAGKYQCMKLWKKGHRDITTVELVVAAVSEPKLSVLSAESGAVTLQCEASCWLPEPEVQFLDDQGNNISAEDPKRDQNASGCYTVTRRVTLQDATKSVTCRVHQPGINQTRDTQILIPVDCMRSCSLAISIAVAEGDSSVQGPPETVLAFAGEAVILPCSFSPIASDDFPTVEWSKKDLQPNVVFLYRDGCETYEMKNLLFQYRTSFITKELKNRNISLRLSNVQLSDAGKYQCMRLWKNGRRDITTVELVVAAVSEPKLSVLSAESGAVTLQCEASCWLPEPEVQFLDDQGNNISAEDPKRDQNASGCYTVTRRVTLQDATNRVTCRVHQPYTNQTRVTVILIPADCMRSCSLTTGIAVGEAILLLFASLCGLAVSLWKRCGKSAEGRKLLVMRKSSDQSTMSDTYENEPFLESVRVERTESLEDSTIDRLTRQVADLKSKLHEKEETIRQLRNNKSQRSPAVCQFGHPCSPATSVNSNPPKSGNVLQSANSSISRRNSNPEPECPIPRDHRIHSSPAILNFNFAMSSSSSSSNTLKKTQDKTGSLINPKVTPDTGIKVPNLRRRHSLAHPLAVMSNNRFSLLADLSEESELLIS